MENSQSLTAEVFHSKRSLLLDEAEFLERKRTGRSMVWGTAPKCWLGVPLLIKDEIIGVLAVQDYTRSGAYAQKDVALLESAAGQIGISIERKRAEEEIQRQLAEKEILLKEVHHRIKNNFASVSGLLTLQSQALTDPWAAAVLQETIGRVDSMRILYDKLLLSEGYMDLSVKNYLDDLVDRITAIFPSQARIKIDLRIDDFHLDAKRLFPLGIIINELLTNIMKYAFIKRKTGRVEIALTLAKKHVTLTIQDNGRGLPAGFDMEKSKGFGLMLVKMLSQQLGGSFSMETRKGTRCKIEFDI